MALAHAVGDMPMISASNYAATAYGINQFGQLAANPPMDWNPEAQKYLMLQTKVTSGTATTVVAPQPKEIDMTKRLVQVVIADPNENVPLADSLLYNGEPLLTDLTDQELYFEIDIKSLLAAHNEKRIKFVDKKVKERTEYLEAAKVRDLKMVVVSIASF